MKDKYKRYLKLNLVSLVFIGVSFISITLAWFAYSGIVNTETKVSVKAWYIEFSKDGTKKDTNDIVISLDDIYPGMTPIFESVDIENMGDSLAQITYSVTSARILEDNLENGGLTELQLEDKLSHDYPFHVNINLSKRYAEEKKDDVTGKSKFTVSVSWPLDSGDDLADSNWGKDSYLFQTEEERKYNADNSYQKRSALKIVINLKAEQFLNQNDSPDYKYNMGDIILYDVVKNSKCDSDGLSIPTCLKTYVIDPDNKIGDTEVRLLPDLYKTYREDTFNNYQLKINDLTKNDVAIGEWTVPIENLEIKHLLKAISTDVINSELVYDLLPPKINLSPAVIGNLNYAGNIILDGITYEGRFNAELSKAIGDNSYYKFLNNSFQFLETSRCYWTNTEADANNAFALIEIDENTSKIYKIPKNSKCNIVPIIKAPKAQLNDAN